MNLPHALINSLIDAPGFNKQPFEAVHASGEQVTSIRINPLKLRVQAPNAASALEANPKSRLEPITDHSQISQSLNDSTRITQSVNDSDRISQTFNNSDHLHPFISESNRIPWSTYGYYLDKRPSFTLDPLLHAGCYYVQEASSMFLEQALKQTIDLSQPLKVLDLCAAPGGKSTLIQSLISADSLLVSNEVIKSRSTILQENITKWGAPNVVVTSNDAKDFARLENYFDVIVIDAPCSGSGLFRRDPAAIDEWSEANVMLCSQRQQRIVADAMPALKKNGILIYCTCSYSIEEDEAVADWISEQFALSGLQLQLHSSWNIIESFSPNNKVPGYRFYPDKLKGEGFFLTCLQKQDGRDTNPHSSKQKTEKLTKAEQQAAMQWIDPNAPLHLFRHKEDAIAVPLGFESILPLLQDRLYLRQAGINMGKLVKNELIPDHALALSTILNNSVPKISLELQQALQYLRKADIVAGEAQKGWAVIRYQGHNLGWVKILSNRLNNYYPKEWRILKS